MIYIGIDPDVDKSGYAVLDSKTKELDLYNYSFWEIIEDLKSYLIPITVIIEAGWLHKKSNWHGQKNVYTAAKIGKNVGANHQVGKLLHEYCILKGFKCILVKPKGKIPHKEFKAITGYKKRTNQDQRDAGMLVYGL